MFRIGVAELVAVTWLPRFAAMVRERFPRVILRFEVAMSPAMTDAIRSGALDMAFLIRSEATNGLTMRPLGAVPFAWMAGAGFELPRGPMTMEALRRLPIIYQTANSTLNRLMEALLRSEGVGRQDGTSCNSLAARVSLTVAGLGISLMPLVTAARDIEEGRLRVVPVDPARVDVPYAAVSASLAAMPAIGPLMDMAVEASAASGWAA